MIMSEMVKKEDNRIRYTKLRIRSAFYELIQEVGYEKVTVTSICNRAEINRATFYKHYLDVPDLVDKLQEAAIEELSSKIQVADHSTIEEFITEALKYIRGSNTENTVLSTFSSQNGALFSQKISVLFYNKFSCILDKYVNAGSKSQKDILFAYISAGSAGIIDYWSKSGFVEDEKVIAKSILSLAKATLNNDA